MAQLNVILFWPQLKYQHQFQILGWSFGIFCLPSWSFLLCVHIPSMRQAFGMKDHMSNDQYYVTTLLSCRMSWCGWDRTVHITESRCIRWQKTRRMNNSSSFMSCMMPRRDWGRGSQLGLTEHQSLPPGLQHCTFTRSHYYCFIFWFFDTHTHAHTHTSRKIRRKLRWSIESGTDCRRSIVLLDLIDFGSIMYIMVVFLKWTRCHCCCCCMLAMSHCGWLVQTQTSWTVSDCSLTKASLGILTKASHSAAILLALLSLAVM